MAACDNAFAIRNVSTEDVYLQFPGLYVIHPGESANLIALGIAIQTIATSNILFIQFNRGRLIQIPVSGKNNLTISTLQNTKTQYTQYETEQLIRGCSFTGDLGPYDPLGGGGSSLTRVSALLGNGSNQLFNVTHNLNTEEIFVQVYSNLAPKDNVYPRIDRINLNQIQVKFDRPPYTNQYTIIVLG